MAGSNPSMHAECKLSLCFAMVMSQGCCAGNCAVAFDQFCKSVLPGDGRFADCLTEQMQQEENGNVEGVLLLLDITHEYLPNMLHHCS